MKTVLTKLRKNLIAGMLVILPGVATVFVLWWVFARLINPFVNKVIRRVMLFLVPDRMEHVFGLEAAFLWNIIGVFVFVAFLVLLGTITRNIIGRKFIAAGEGILARIPIVSKIYGSAQQIGQAFLGEKRTGFTRVVLFEYPRRGLYSFGLVSGKTRGEIQDKIEGEKVLSVFVPTTPNPTSGFIILVPEKDTIPLEMTVADALSLLISGGAVVPRYNSQAES